MECNFIEQTSTDIIGCMHMTLTYTRGWVGFSTVYDTVVADNVFRQFDGSADLDWNWLHPRQF